MKEEIILSSLGHTWILDLDGTIVKHNGYKLDGHDTLLPGVAEFLGQIPERDLVIFLTSRTDEYRDGTIRFLEENKIRYDRIIFNAPYGERILINDDKPGGLHMSLGINKTRDSGLDYRIRVDPGI